jgi:hypothetical protein
VTVERQGFTGSEGLEAVRRESLGGRFPTGLPKTQVLLWGYGNELRAVFDNVVLAEHQCRYDLRDGVAGVIGGFFMVVEVAKIITFLDDDHCDRKLHVSRPDPSMCLMAARAHAALSG